MSPWEVVIATQLSSPSALKVADTLIIPPLDIKSTNSNDLRTAIDQLGYESSGDMAKWLKFKHSLVQQETFILKKRWSDKMLQPKWLSQYIMTANGNTKLANNSWKDSGGNNLLGSRETSATKKRGYYARQSKRKSCRSNLSARRTKKNSLFI